jgi:hypothetical protein
MGSCAACVANKLASRISLIGWFGVVKNIHTGWYVGQEKFIRACLEIGFLLGISAENIEKSNN